jgi:hypothetical protein
MAFAAASWPASLCDRGMLAVGDLQRRRRIIQRSVEVHDTVKFAAREHPFVDRLALGFAFF